MVDSASSASGGQPVEKSTGTSRWIILIILALGAVLGFVDRTNIAQALAAPEFVKHFNLTNLDRGTLNSAFFWSYAALQIPMGWIVDRYGVKLPYTICFAVWCIASAACGLADSFMALILLRVLTGVGEAIVTPASYRWIRSNFSEGQSGLAVGVYSLGTKIGPALGGPIAAWLIVNHDWRIMFAALGLGGLLWLIPWNLLVKSDSPKAGSVKKKSAVPLKNILVSPLVWGTIVINFCYNYFVFYCMTWMPAYLVEHRGLSLKKEGLYTFFSFAGIALVALTAGFVADLMIKRGWNAVIVRKTFVICGFAIACTELLGVMADTEQMALFWTVVSLSGLGLATANHLALCRLTLIPAPAVGLVTGVQNVSTSLAGIVTPLLSGWLLQETGGYTAPMLVIFVFLVIGGLTTLFLLKEKWAPKVPETAVE